MTTFDERLAEIKQRLEKATPGPWVAGYWSGHCNKNHRHASNDGPCKYDYTLRTEGERDHHSIVLANEPVTVVETTEEYGALSKSNAELIAHSPTDIAYLLEAVSAMREALEFIAGLPGEDDSPHADFARKALERLEKLSKP